MARNINDRLSQLDARRKGTDRLNRVSASAANDVLAKSLIAESWQKRATTKPNTRYALGAMQSVDQRYTEISLETAERVGKQLESGLPAYGASATFKLQGSVPLDVHIRGVSDVDLLTLDASFRTYDRNGAWSSAGIYQNPTTRTSAGAIAELRNAAEKVLKSAYPVADVDCNGAKCIALSGGSLARPVDVVPSHWHDTVEYQGSGQEHDRAVTILNKRSGTTLDNLPFLHIHRVHSRDTVLSGGLKKAIRLTKSVKSDAENQTEAAKLPSFDIAALLYHADQSALLLGRTYELAILAEAQRFLDWCYRNQSQSTLLLTPDGTRRILDTPAKIEGLLIISMEMDALAASVAKEQVAQLQFGQPNFSAFRDALTSSVVPAAA